MPFHRRKKTYKGLIAEERKARMRLERARLKTRIGLERAEARRLEHPHIYSAGRLLGHGLSKGVTKSSRILAKELAGKPIKKRKSLF